MGKTRDEKTAKNSGELDGSIYLVTDLGNPIKLHPKPLVGRAANHSDTSCKILKSCVNWYL